MEAHVEPWRTAISDSDDAHVWIRGHDLASLMTGATFADVVFLLHSGRLPSVAERRVMDAMLIAIADHGPGAPSAMAARTVASGNRQAPEAAVAAGILAIGDAHAGAGFACMNLIVDGLGRVRRDGIAIDGAATQIVDEAIAAGRRLPGFGHRTHSRDPRTLILFDLVEKSGLAGDGVRFVRALESAIAVTIRPLPANVDGAFAGVLHDLGFPPLMAKLIFMIGRVAGLTAQVTEEYTREKPMRIKVPVVYDGPPPIDSAGGGR
jgi:citrate synthase